MPLERALTRLSSAATISRGSRRACGFGPRNPERVNRGIGHHLGDGICGARLADAERARRRRVAAAFLAVGLQDAEDIRVAHRRPRWNFVMKPLPMNRRRDVFWGMGKVDSPGSTGSAGNAQKQLDTILQSSTCSTDDEPRKRRGRSRRSPASRPPVVPCSVPVRVALLEIRHGTQRGWISRHRGARATGCARPVVAASVAHAARAR